MTKVNSTELRDKIIQLCKQKPELADDDYRLVANIWWSEGWHDTQLNERLHSVTSFSTITRTRRKLTEEGKIKPSSSARASRRFSENEVREAVKNG